MASAVCSGFVLEPPWDGNVPAILLLGGVLQALFLLFAYRRLTTWLGTALGLILAIGAAVYIRTYDPPVGESDGSALLFVLATALTALFVFLLSRTRPGTAVLFLGGNLIIAGAHFLQFPVSLWALLLFDTAAAAQFFWRVYTRALLRAQLGQARPWGYLRQLLLIVLAAFLLAGGAYAGIVQPLNPPTQELKLITLLKSMDLLETLGVSSVRTILDTEQTSAQTPDQTEFGAQSGEELSDAMEGAEDEPEEQENTPPEEPESGPSAMEQILSAVRYDMEEDGAFWPAAVVVLLIAVVILLRAALKRRWRRRVRALSREDAAINYYRLFLRRLGRSGLKRSAHQTLREFTAIEARRLEAFSAGACTFAALTELYERTLYGHCPITQAELDQFEQFYDSLSRNLRREMGTVKYCLRAAWL